MIARFSPLSTHLTSDGKRFSRMRTVLYITLLLGDTVWGVVMLTFNRFIAGFKFILLQGNVKNKDSKVDIMILHHTNIDGSFV